MSVESQSKKEEIPDIKSVRKSPPIPVKKEKIEEKLDVIPGKIEEKIDAIPEKIQKSSEIENTTETDNEEVKKDYEKVRRPKLIVIDIDGLLVDRQYDANIKSFNSKEFDTGESDTFYIPHFKITIRPKLRDLWSVLFGLSDDNVSFFFAIWSSSNKFIFDRILTKIIPERYYPSKFLFIWDRNMCELDPDYGKNPKIESHSTVKKLDTILNNSVANKLRKWKWDDEDKNILIIDNDENKLRFNPPESRLVFSEFEEDIFSILKHPFFELEVV
jgi:hypothetical protein